LLSKHFFRVSFPILLGTGQHMYVGHVNFHSAHMTRTLRHSACTPTKSSRYYLAKILSQRSRLWSIINHYDTQQLYVSIISLDSIIHICLGGAYSTYHSTILYKRFCFWIVPFHTSCLSLLNCSVSFHIQNCTITKWDISQNPSLTDLFTNKQTGFNNYFDPLFHEIGYDSDPSMDW